jgi:hypothetical protein
VAHDLFLGAPIVKLDTRRVRKEDASASGSTIMMNYLIVALLVEAMLICLVFILIALADRYGEGSGGLTL